MTHAYVRVGRAVFFSTFAAAAVTLMGLGGPLFAEAPESSPTESLERAAAPETSVVDPAPPTPTETEPSAGPQEDSVTPHVRISGNVWRMNPGLVFLRTPIGLMTLTCKTCLRELRGNPTVTLFVHGARGAVHIIPRKAGAPTRRYVWGPVAYAASDKTTVVFWTPEGEQQFPTDGLSTRLASVPRDATITVEIGEGGKLLGVHDLRFDLQVSQLPSHASDTELTVTGPISKIKNGYVHVQTDLGMLPITSKTGLCQGKGRCRVKVGEELTLWIHDTSIAIDVHQAGSSTPAVRLLTGKLVYADPEKNALSLWTPEGEQSFPTGQAKKTLSSLKEGSPITVELNGDGVVSDIRKGN